MSTLVPILPFVLAAARSLTLGIQSLSGLEWRPTIPAEAEYEFLAVAIFCLLGLLVALSLIMRFPDFGTVIAEYNQF
ncbi:MAG: hypothetical protein WAK55_01775 [Xanthobacteraceae bacterium]